MTIETYRVVITNTDQERNPIIIDPLVYGFDNATYFDDLDEVVHDELIYMDAGETMTITIERLS